MTVELSGFQKHTRTGLVLQVSQTATVNVALDVGGLAEEVTVSAESPLLETSNANRGTVIDSARIAELPLQSRSPMALAMLVAGVNYNAQAIYLRPFDNGALADWSMNGGQNRNNEFLLDGAPNNANQGGNNIAYVPAGRSRAGVQGLDQLLRRAVRPHRRRRRQHVAEVGHQLASTASATSYYRRKWLDANSFLLNSRSDAEDAALLDQYGFSVDGPVDPGSTTEEQDVLPVHRREVPRRHAGGAVQHDADRGDEERRFQQVWSTRRARPDHHLRPRDRP